MQRIFLYTLLLLLCPAIYGQQDDFDEIKNRTERIINFHSDVVIDTTGMIYVTESIEVFAGGKDIKRGIVRSIPVYRPDRYGKKKKMDVDIISVSCNGHEEDYKIEDVGDDQEIYIGNRNTFLKPGIYVYVITYKSSGQIGFFDTYDELYWNVTGNDWEFYIERASASITLPNDAQRINTSCYTGVSGATDMNCTSEDAGNKVNFETNGRLSAHEGFTVAVSFPRDIVKRPPPPTRLELFWEEYKHPVSAFICLLLFGIYFYFTWKKAGQDPRKPVVIPTFNPPHGWSPAVTRYLYKRKYDDKAFTAALVEMAVKKAIRISDKNKQYTLEPVERKENLREEEQKIYDTLFPRNEGITVSDKNYKKFADANSNVTKSLQESLNLKDYFLNNTKYVGWGTLLTTALMALYVLMTEELPLAGIILFTVPLIGLAVTSMVMEKLGKGCLPALLKVLGLFVFGAVTLFFSMAELWIILFSLKENWIFLLTLFTSYGIYIYLIKAPTKLGAQTVSELKGFKMYLKTAEEVRLNLLTPPEKTPELFEKLLPYAIALGVENQWGKKFTKILKQFNYEPDWYHGDRPFTSSSLPSTFGRSFSSSVGSARVNPASSSSSGGSWSSGSSGGGRSGGGGGGGGGRGW